MEGILDFCDFGDVCVRIPPRKRSPFLRSKCDHEPTVCSVVFHCFFECPFLLILCDLECPETPFWEAFGITFPAEARNQKSVFGLHRRVRIAYPAFRKMHFSQFVPSFFLKPCAGGHFDSILVFGGLPRGTLGHHFGGRGCKKMRSEKTMQKVFKNGSAGHASKGLWAP